MTTFNTGNRLGSNAPKDLYDNAENLDNGINGTAKTWTDRLGVVRKSWNGIETDFQQFLADGSTIEFPTWDSASAAAGAGQIPLNRQVAVVGDPATHVDPITGQTVPNSGRYVMVGGGLEWRSADVITQKADLKELNRRTAAAATKADRVPLFVDENSNVPLWLENGSLDAHRVSESFNRKVLDGHLGSLAVGRRFVPLFVDDAGQVPLFLQDGVLSGPAMPEPSTNSLNVSDGRGLYAWRSKIARLDDEGVGNPRILISGDSWAEYAAIPSRFASIISDRYTRSGAGWISVNGMYLLDGITFSRSGWSLYDASSGASPEFATGVDGMYVRSDGSDAAISIGNCKCSELRIYYVNTGGKFRYSVDDGEFVEVATSSDGALSSVVLSGMDDIPHVFRVDTSGNSGSVVVCGFLATSDMAGVELLKTGNAGLDGLQLARFTRYISDVASDFPPDVVLVFLGTNDYRRSSSTVPAYIAGLESLVAAYRESSPECGFIFVAPADTDGVAVTPLADYCNALLKWCADSGHEFYNMHDEWGGYSAMNGLGMWVDALHVNGAGARSLASRIFKLLLDC